MTKPLTITNHNRDSAGMTYVYPVVSRRAGGISIGINFNSNNACNWRCIYCQVPNLKRGAAPAVDLTLLEEELRSLLADIDSGVFYQRFEVPPRYRELRDIAISGNGEPTSLKDFHQVIAHLGTLFERLNVPQNLNKVIISNGSLVHREPVQKGLNLWGEIGGQLWFKLDSATPKGMRQINQAAITPERVMTHLQTAAHCCPTWLQSCLFTLDGQLPKAEEQHAYLDFLCQARQRGIALQGVMLYSLARPSMQPQAHRLGPVPEAWLSSFAQKIRNLGITVKMTP